MPRDYSEAFAELQQISNDMRDLDGSVETKIDTIARHVRVLALHVCRLMEQADAD